MCLKSYFKEIVLKLATDGQRDKSFLLTSTFVPKDQVSGERLQDHWSSGLKVFYHLQFRDGLPVFAQ